MSEKRYVLERGPSSASGGTRYVLRPGIFEGSGSRLVVESEVEFFRRHPDVDDRTGPKVSDVEIGTLGMVTHEDGDAQSGYRTSDDGFQTIGSTTSFAGWTPIDRVVAFGPVTILTAEQVKQIENLPEMDPRSRWSEGYLVGISDALKIIRGEA